MASYAMCHMKLDMILTELGYKPAKEPPRLSVFLTNSLEEGEPANQTLPFTQWLSREAKGANTIKRDMPIMCVIGNPPYSGHSSNKGKWIEGLMADYKRSPELKRPAQAKWLSDDYVKFIRFAEHLIDKNGKGVLGFITNHSYLDNPTFMDIRKHLLDTFDRIYVFDLHGNSKKKEVSPDGTTDKNVFDIQQGVAILVGVKKKDAKPHVCRVSRTDVWGSRLRKYEWLVNAQLNHADSVDVTPISSPWLFTTVDPVVEKAYSAHFSLEEFFSPNGRPAPGIVTTHDQFAISESKEQAIKKVEVLLSSVDEAEARTHFRLCTQDQWQYNRAKSELSSSEWRNYIVPLSYRPFDNRFTVYDGNVAVHRRERVMKHFLRGPNIGLLITKACRDRIFAHVFVTDKISEAIFLSGSTATNAMNLPLYLYPEEGDFDQTRRVNFDTKLFGTLKKLADHPDHGKPDEVAVFDYIYGVLHCPAYRAEYAEFLKKDFPRIPWPVTPDEFWDVATKGNKLRKLHLMDPTAIGSTQYPFVGEGNNNVDAIRFEDEKIWVNDSQYFAGAPEIAWSFPIGGYMPAQKWLKDKMGRSLSFDEVKQYQRMLKVLAETDAIMRTIMLQFH